MHHCRAGSSPPPLLTTVTMTIGKWRRHGAPVFIPINDGDRVREHLCWLLKSFLSLSQSNLINFDEIIWLVMFLPTCPKFVPVLRAIFSCILVIIKQKSSESSNKDPATKWCTLSHQFVLFSLLPQSRNARQWGKRVWMFETLQMLKWCEIWMLASHWSNWDT